ncbi:MAG TPA: hypothetical protein VH374_12185 [Polyangia bacterium]|nr:hypothetical protein [Polyangia bacterium]
MKASARTRTPSNRPRRPEAAGPKGRSDDGNAFFPDPEDGPARAPDDLAEEMGEEFVQSVTGGDTPAEDALNADVAEDIGGPFVETHASEELAPGTDGSNPVDAEAEPLPRAVGGLLASPTYDEQIDAGEDGDTLVDTLLDDDTLEPDQIVDIQAAGRVPGRRR